MKGLEKYLRQAFLADFFSHALETLPAGCFLAVLDEQGAILSSGGPCPDDPNSLPAEHALRFPLSLHNEVLGYVVCGPANKPLASVSGRFIAFSLKEILQRETLRHKLGEETLNQFRDQALIRKAIENLNHSMRLGDVISALLGECRRLRFSADGGLVFLKDPKGSEYDINVAFGPLSPKDLMPISQSRLFEEILHNSDGEIVNDLDRDSRWRNETLLLGAMLLSPLRSSSNIMGALVLYGLKNSNQEERDTFSSADLKKCTTLTSAASTAMSNAAHFEQIHHILSALMESMATAIDARDRCTAGHSQRVALYALRLAELVNADEEFFKDVVFSNQALDEIYYAGLLHDVGKIGVREDVLAKSTRLPRLHMEIIGLRLSLWGQISGKPWQEMLARLEKINKAYELQPEDENFIKNLCQLQVAPGMDLTVLSLDERRQLFTPRGNLTAAEWREIRRHPTESYRILRNIPFNYYFPNILQIILEHHERLDGSGYPLGLSGKEILLQSRILAVVDVYDSLRRDRHYKKAKPQGEALLVLHEEMEMGRLDGCLVELLSRHIASVEHSILSDMDLLVSVDHLQ